MNKEEGSETSWCLGQNLLFTWLQKTKQNKKKPSAFLEFHQVSSCESSFLSWFNKITCNLINSHLSSIKRGEEPLGTFSSKIHVEF